jgi:hypothetical protein
MTTPLIPTVPPGALTATAQSNTGFDPSFQQRLVVLGTAYALQVTLEGSEVDNHVARELYAREFLGAPVLIAQNQLSWAVLGDLQTSSSADDADLLTRIGAVWNSLAGIG